MRVADTSALYALFSATDAHHAEARQVVADPEPFVIPGEIVAETLALVHYRAGFAESLQAGQFLRQLPHASVEPSTTAILDEAFEVFQDGGGILSFPDAVVVATCRAVGGSVIAFDTAIRNAT